MDERHDQNIICKILKIWSKACVFCCKEYPIPTIILILSFLLYLFFPFAFKFVIYLSPLVGILLLVHRHFLGINLQKVRHVEKDDRKKKFAKSRRSFKSVYSDRGKLIRRNTMNRNHDYIDTNDKDKDDIFSKSLDDLLTDRKAKDLREVKFESIAGNGESSSANGDVNCNNKNNNNKDVSKHNVKAQDCKIMHWTKENQKNDMDLGLSETERNKRLESLMVRRRSRKNLGFEEGGSTKCSNNNNVQISAIKTSKINPFLEDHSGGKKSPGSAPSFMLTTSNPFDLPYDPHEEKLDLTGDNFHQEFTVGQPKEPVFCRHESFSLGGFPHSVTAHDKHERSRYNHLSDKQKSAIEFETSTLDNEGDNKHIQHDSPISDDSISSNHPNKEVASSEQAVGVLCEEDGTTINPQEIDSYDDRKADINFLQGIKKRIHHAASNSIVSDLQVELSDEDTPPTLDDLDIEKDRQSFLNSSNPEANSGTIQGNHIHEPLGVPGEGSVAQAAPDGLTKVTMGQASVGSSSPKYVLQQEFSANPASPYNIINETQLSDDQARETSSSDNVLHQTNDSDEHPSRDRDIDNSQDQNVHEL
ncbi:hypothetical protein R6Q59_025765 [Mikania micrantha]